MIKVRSSWQDAMRDFQTLDDYFAIEGEIAREIQNRKVTHFYHGEKSLYIKCHYGVGWSEIIKNWLLLKKPVLGATDEWEAIHALQRINVDTMEPIALGKDDGGYATQRSFIVTKDIGKSIHLEALTQKFPDIFNRFQLKRALLKRVSDITLKLHSHGINHRDLYICHFELCIPGGIENIDIENFSLKLMDLHRAQIRRHIPERWRVKDVASLYFSAMDIGLSQRDILRFMRYYMQKPLKETLNRDKAFWKKVIAKTNKLYRRDWRKKPNWILPPMF
ncbi:MAG: lipopolysaccharide core heptose(I) kinase RfaP [Pseudomonadota bacterium]